MFLHFRHKTQAFERFVDLLEPTQKFEELVSAGTPADYYDCVVDDAAPGKCGVGYIVYKIFLTFKFFASHFSASQDSANCRKRHVPRQKRPVVFEFLSSYIERCHSCPERNVERRSENVVDGGVLGTEEVFAARELSAQKFHFRYAKALLKAPTEVVLHINLMYR